MYLASAGYVQMTADAFPVVKLTQAAAGVLKGTETVAIRKERVQHREKTAKKKAQGTNPELYERLTALRKELADAKGVPAFYIFSNSTLQAMAGQAPRTEAELLEVSGVGEKKLAAYGSRFLEAIGQWHRLAAEGQSL